MRGIDAATIGELPPELSGGLTFHLPMELAALRYARADEHEIAARLSDGLSAAFAAGMVDPPMYRWAVDRYRSTAEQLLDIASSERLAALADIEPLAEGLAGAAFHGLIRLGYACWVGDPLEVARGLAYLRTRRQVLASPPRTELTRSAERDVPPPDLRSGATVFELLNVAAASHACRCASGEASPRHLALEAGRLVRRNPSSFVAIHALTSLHALCEFDVAVSGDVDSDGPLAPWWQALATAHRACALVVDSAPSEDGPDGAIVDVPTTMVELLAGAVRSADTHELEVAMSLDRLVALGVLDAAEAVVIGTARRSAGVLDH